MKKLSALLLSLLLLLTACGTPATPGAAVTLPTPNDEILVEEGLHAEDLPEVCRLWFDLAETSGAEKFGMAQSFAETVKAWYSSPFHAS